MANATIRRTDVVPGIYFPSPLIGNIKNFAIQTPALIT